MTQIYEDTEIEDLLSPFLFLDIKSKRMGQDPQLLKSNIAPLLLAKLGRFTLAKVIACSVSKRSFCPGRFFLSLNLNLILGKWPV